MVSASQYPQSINVDPGLELRLGRELEKWWGPTDSGVWK